MCEELVSKAVELRLYEDPYWLQLGHYRAGWFGRQTSLIEDPLFFLDPNGKYDPKAELVATIRAFFEPPSDDPEQRHPVCRFPARLSWLKERLPFDESPMPVPECDVFQRVYAQLKPTSITLVFPAAYMNSPASMFGHTLLVFDSKDKNRLLSKGIGYAAAVTTGFGPLFAMQGILGMYPGRYNVESYYDKVEQYNDIHRRDIWEYELDFTQEEVDRMFMHTWELQNIWSRYYFFDENCAYKLYQILDAGRPSLCLSDDPTWFVIPIDTVKRIAAKGIIRDTSFRPSKSTRMHQISSRLSPQVRDEALEVARGRVQPSVLATNESIPLVERKLGLDLGADYAQYLFTELKLGHEEYTKRYLSILRERSKLGPRSDEEFIIVPPARPELGHAASMLAPGVSTENGKVSASLSGRVAYHGLMDNDTGYSRGAQIFFLNTEARWLPGEDEFELRFMDIVNVESLAPRDELFSPASWRARIGVSQMDMYEDQDSTVFMVQTGSGATWTPDDHHLIFTMIEAEIHTAGRYEEYLAGGPGVALGWIYTVTEDIKAVSRARTAWIYEGQDDWWRAEANIGLDYRLAQELSIRGYYQYTRNDRHDINETNLSLNFYF